MIGRDVLSQLKKVASSLLIVGLLFLGAPLSTSAQGGPVVPVSDYVNTVVNATLTEAYLGKEYEGLDQLGWWLQKLVIQQITQQMVNWFNTNFNGGPGFVTDPFGELVQIATNEAENFIGGSGLDGLNDAFETNVRSTLASYFLDNFSNKVSNNNLPPAIQNAGDYERFVGGDFSQGGWESFVAVTQSEAGTSYSAFLTGETELGRRIAQRQENEQMVWDWADGIRSVLDEATGVIQTPGIIVQDQLNNVLGSGIRQLEIADEFNEIVGALTAQLTQQLFTGFGSSLSSLSDLGSSYLEELANDSSGRDDAESVTVTPDLPNTGSGSGTPRSTFINGNIARGNGVITEQSGTYQDFRSDNAVDGQIDSYGGADEKASSVTGARAYPWWQIDLRGNYAIDIIRIIPRPEVSSSAAVGTYRVFVSDTAFSNTLDPTNPPSGVWASTPQNPGGDINSVYLNRRGRFVRVQRIDTGPTGSARLQLAEVEVIENIGPTIQLNGSTTMTINEGDNYNEPGATVSDQLDPNPTLEISGSVNENQPGSYTITYTATDSGGAETVVTRTVNVVAN